MTLEFWLGVGVGVSVWHRFGEALLQRIEAWVRERG
jgi:hypothetical protein